MVATISANGSRLYCGSFGGILGTALAKVEVPPELYRVLGSVITYFYATRVGKSSFERSNEIHPLS
jgi:hypothetical protein